MTDNQVTCLAVMDTNLFAGVSYGGVWRRPLSEMIMQQPTTPIFGTMIGTFNGVPAYSNGSVDSVSNEYNSLAGINTGMEWQCVEYVNRYYYVIYGLNIRIAGQNANQYYDNPSSRGLVSYANGGIATPQVGDILCFSGGPAGHVAIVRNVGATSVTVIQQNVRENSDDTDYTYPLSVSNGTFTIDGTKLGTGYSCQGWLRTVSALSVNDKSESLPNSYSLYQNYPNPFNPTTIIGYDISKLSHVRLIVYDILGRQVETLVNGEKSPGRYQAIFNANSLSSGAYFYRITTGDFVATKTLMLVK